MNLKDKFYRVKKMTILKIKGCRFTKIGCLSRLIFGFAIFLFLITIVPSFFYRMPFYDYFYKNGVFPYEYKISGIVCDTVKDADNLSRSKKVGVIGASVSVGGFSTVTDINGEFSVEFISNDNKDIPVVVIYNGNEYVYQVTINGKDEIHQEFDLNEK